MKKLIVCVLLLGCSRSSGLPIDDDRVGETTVTSAAAPESDQQLIRRVETSLAENPSLSIAASDVEVDAVDGAIVLRGTVADAATKEGLAAAVERASGHVVLDKIAVAPRGKVDDRESDDTIAFKLQRALLNDATAAREMDGVSIDVVRGVVTLRGKASSEATRLAVEDVVQRTPGVVATRNELAVRP